MSDNEAQPTDPAAHERIPEIIPPAGSHETEEENKMLRNRKDLKAIGDQVFTDQKNGIMYIMSKEQHPIPKLTDEQIMERHKKADESMKNVWSSIIAKYESMEDQGDIVDLRTGEILEDNGHLRGISQQPSSDHEVTRYKSTSKDILSTNIEQEEADEYSIWQDEGTDDEEDGDYVEELSQEEASGDNNRSSLEYITPPV